MYACIDICNCSEDTKIKKRIAEYWKSIWSSIQVGLIDDMIDLTFLHV